MSELIDRQAVRLAKVPYDEQLSEYERGWNDACEAIADNVPSAPRWVRCVEEQPKEHGPFLCASKSTMLDGSTHWFFELCWYSDGDLKDVVWDAEKDSGFYSWSASQDRDIDSKVDYWMPIEPPQEDA